MGIIARIAIGVLAISFMTFVAFFGRLPALRYVKGEEARKKGRKKETQVAGTKGWAGITTGGPRAYPPTHVLVTHIPHMKEGTASHG